MTKKWPDLISDLTASTSNYSPNLPPLDTKWAPKLKKCLVGRNHQSNKEELQEVNGYYENLQKG